MSRDDRSARFVLMPALLLILVFVYAFILFTVFISFTGSKGGFSAELSGLKNYLVMFSLPHWQGALKNFVIFSVLFIFLSILLGLILAILVDWSRVGDRFFRPVYLLPMAVSLIVAGTAWKWVLDPSSGIQQILQVVGLGGLRFDWLDSPGYAVYMIVMAAVWQVTGYVMTIFLVGLRAVSHTTIESAVVDGAGVWKLYSSIVIPQLGPYFISVLVILGHMAVKSFDLVAAMTEMGASGTAELPTTFMFSSAFGGEQLGVGAAAAVVILILYCLVSLPNIKKIVKER